MEKARHSVILITGASSGIGRATALLLMSKGFHVYGTSRKALGLFDAPPDETDGASGGFIRMLPLEVTDPASVEAAVAAVFAREGRLDVLVSNAGYGIAGPVEETAISEVKKQFDANFFGAFHIISRVLPFMRDQGCGKIIVIGSVAGIIAIPFQSVYSASKFALEGLVEALRPEIAPFGIQACIIEPGDTKTGFTNSRIYDKAGHASHSSSKESTDLFSRTDFSPYRHRFEKSVNRMEKDEKNGASPDTVAQVVYRMIMKKRMPVRTSVGFTYKALLFLKRLLPSRLTEKLISKLYG